jgi:hypothetical protein
MGAPRWLGYILVALCSGQTACTPTLNWRDVRPARSRLLIQFPCRPSVVERTVALAGATVRLTLYACKAGGQTWALELAETASRSRAEAVLGELRRDIAANVGAKDERTAPLSVRGAISAHGATQLVLSGHRPDGRAVRLQVALFTDGAQVFQATVMGEQLVEPAVENFFASLKLGR